MIDDVEKAREAFRVYRGTDSEEVARLRREHAALLAFARNMAAHPDRDIPADVRAILDREHGR